MPKIHKKWPIYVVHLQVRGLSESYTMCQVVPIANRFHMGYAPSGFLAETVKTVICPTKDP